MVRYLYCAVCSKGVFRRVRAKVSRGYVFGKYSMPKSSVMFGAASIPVYCVQYITSHPPGALFQARLFDNPEGANTERCIRLRKALGQMFATPIFFLAPALFRVSRYRAWKSRVPRGCDVHHRTEDVLQVLRTRYYYE